MMLVCNRFAILPHMCPECKRYIWLEGYRRADIYKPFAGRYIKENICRSCLKKFDVIIEEFNSVGNVNAISAEEMKAAKKHFDKLAAESKIGSFSSNFRTFRID